MRGQITEADRYVDPDLAQTISRVNQQS